MYKKSVLLFTMFLLFSSFAIASGPRWVSLFNGKDMSGWIQKAGKATYRVEDGTIIGKTTKMSLNSFLCSEKEYGNFELKFEVKLFDDDLNSGVQIRSKTKKLANQGNRIVVYGPQVEIMASGESGGYSGYLYGEGIHDWMTPANKLIRHKVYKDGKWNSYRIVAKGSRIQTWINGKQIEDLIDEEIFKTHPEGFIGLQVHSVQDRGPYQVAWRNIKIRSLDK